MDFILFSELKQKSTNQNQVFLILKLSKVLEINQSESSSTSRTTFKNFDTSQKESGFSYLETFRNFDIN